MFDEKLDHIRGKYFPNSWEHRIGPLCQKATNLSGEQPADVRLLH
jgi:hypothetical protein